MAHVRDASRLCENVHEQRVLRIVLLFSSFDSDCQSGSFVIRGNRGKLSTRKFDVGVFTQPGVQAETPTALPYVRYCRLRSGIALSSSLNCSPAPSRNLRAPRGAN